MPRSAGQQLVKYLADAHCVEVQALTQMRVAPRLAGEDSVAAAYRHHAAETAGHERSIRARLEAHGATSSRFKDLAGQAGGWGMLLFARSQPDTAGKLAAHAFSYEKMEVAMYGLLTVAAESAGDSETAVLAGEIAAEESAMAERLAERFDLVVATALAEVTAGELDRHLDNYLADAHALELQATQMLQLAPRIVADEELGTIFAGHLEQTRDQAHRLEERLRQRGAGTSRLKDIALRAGGLNVAGFFAAQPDRTIKLAGFAYAFENLEHAVYELTARVAERAGDAETAALAREIARQESAMADRLAARWRPAMEKRMAEVSSG
jgi:ferritin-like metal-binding protein YciE